MSLTRISWLESARRYFYWIRRTWCLEGRNETFLGSGGRNEPNTHLFAWIGEKKFFHEFDVHDVCKVGIKRFWAQEAEMSLTPISWLESARRYFSWTRRTWCLKSINETFLGSRGRNESNTHQFAQISEKIISHEFDVYDVCKIGIKRFWAQETEMRLTPICSLESAKKNSFINFTYMSIK